MNWHNFSTGEMDDVVSFPITPEEWEPYIPRHRRTEFWLRTKGEGSNVEMIALDILASPWKGLYEEMTK